MVQRLGGKKVTTFTSSIHIFISTEEERTQIIKLESENKQEHLTVKPN